MEREAMFDRAFFALSFLKQTIQDGKRTGDFKQAHYWALEFLERRQATRIKNRDTVYLS